MKRTMSRKPLTPALVSGCSKTSRLDAQLRQMLAQAHNRRDGYMHQTTDRIFLGDEIAADDLDLLSNHNITALLNCSSQLLYNSAHRKIY